MTKTGWIIFATVVVLGLGGLVAWTRIANPPLDLTGINTAKAIAASDKNGSIADHTKGNTESDVTLIEYGDFQCPGCGGAHPYINQLIEEYGDRIQFIFRNFPLTSMHPNAKAAAAAAEAAGLQGKYWEMHNHLYEAQNEWSTADVKSRTDIFNQYAASLGLNVETFKQDLAESAVADKIAFDVAVGKASDITGTPTFYIGKDRMSDEITNSVISGKTDSLKKELDKRLK